MTFYYTDVYLEETATVCGPYESIGPLKRYFDKKYKDLYFGEKSFEKAEIKSVKDSLVLLMKKAGITKKEIDMVVGGDLLNQITASTYGACNVGNSFIGIYGACSSSVLGMIIAANFIQAKFIENAICLVSSHNMSSEKQFRYPTEYGALKPNSCTFTATGAACALLSKDKSKVRIESATLGKIIDYEQNDPNDMGRVMAPSAIDTLVTHLKDTRRTPDYYDLILTGDLGIYGKKIMCEYFENIMHEKIPNIIDSGSIFYKDDNIFAGASGPACLPLTLFDYILKTKKYKKILIIGTGSLHSVTSTNLKVPIPAVSHAVSLEVLN